MSKKLFMVEAISSFHMRYLIQAESATDAKFIAENRDELVEFSQNHLGETVLSVHKIKTADAIDEFRKDNDYLAGWSDEKIISVTLNDDSSSDDENQNFPFPTGSSKNV